MSTAAEYDAYDDDDGFGWHEHVCDQNCTRDCGYDEPDGLPHGLHPANVADLDGPAVDAMYGLRQIRDVPLMEVPAGVMLQAVLAAQRLASYAKAQQVYWTAALARPGTAVPVADVLDSLAHRNEEPGSAGDVPEDLADRAAAGTQVAGDPVWDALLAAEAASAAEPELSAAWLVAPITARRRIADAQELVDELPDTFEALEEGRIEEVRARIIAETTAVLDPQLRRRAETLILDRAKRGMCPGDLRRLATKIVADIDPDAANKRAEQARARRGTGVRNLGDDLGRFTADLPVEDAALTQAVLDLLAKAIPPEARQGRGISQLRADIFADLFGELADTGLIDLRGINPTTDPGDHSDSDRDADHTGAGDTPAPTGIGAGDLAPARDTSERPQAEPAHSHTAPTDTDATDAPEVDLASDTADPAQPGPSETDPAEPEPEPEPQPGETGAEPTGPTAAAEPAAPAADTETCANQTDPGEPAPSRDTEPDLDDADSGPRDPNPDDPADTDTSPNGPGPVESGPVESCPVESSPVDEADPDPDRAPADPPGPSAAELWARLASVDWESRLDPGCARRGGLLSMTRLPAGVRVNLDVTVALSTLAGYDDLSARLAGLGVITADTARALAKAAGTVRILLTNDAPGPQPSDRSAPGPGPRNNGGIHHDSPDCGTVLDFGRTTYRPPATVIDRVDTRDQRCRFPGCPMIALRCDHDHRTTWDDGGATCPCDIDALCRFHHRIKTFTAWSAVRDHSTNTLTWTSPLGRIHVDRPAPDLATGRPINLDHPPVNGPVPSAGDESAADTDTDTDYEADRDPDDPPF